MATYKEIFGKGIKNLSSDLSGDAHLGQIWYNTTSNTLKTLLNSAAWSSGGALNTARGGFSGGAGASVTDGLIGGTSPTAVEQYDGTSWTTKTSPAAATGQRTWFGDSSSAAVQVSGLIWPTIQQTTEEWDGSAWTAGGAFPTAAYTGGATGSLTDGIYWQGFTPPGAATNFSATYDGTSWTNAPNVPESTAYSPAGFGTGSAAVGYSGYGSPTQPTTAFEWNGTSWATTNPVNTGVQYGNGFGIQTAGVKCGGAQPPSAPEPLNSTETYDGTCFSIGSGQLANPRGGGAASGTTNANAFFAGGGPAPVQGTTEEYSSSVQTVKTITTS